MISLKPLVKEILVIKILFRISFALISIVVPQDGSLSMISKMSSTFRLSMIIRASLNCMKMVHQYSPKKSFQLITVKNAMLIQNDHGWR